MSKRKYKVGDEVRTLTDTDMYGNKLFPKGTIGIITEIDSDGNIMVDANEDYWYYSADMIEPVYEGGKHEMTREEAKAEIRKVFEPAFANYIITALVEGATPSERESKWIPVTEQLPEEKKAVLVWCLQYKNIYCAYRENEQWLLFGSYSNRIVNDVVAWMPLPKPYGYGTEMEQ